MSRPRIRMNFDLIRSYPATPEALALVERKAREIESGLGDVQSRIDSQPGPNRARAAVIAGYEPGATAENTREALLRAMGGADG